MIRSTARGQPTSAGSRQWRSRRGILIRNHERNFTHKWARRTLISRRLPGIFIHKLCFGELEPVLDTLCWLKAEARVWFEVTTLLIPGHNDSKDEIARLSDWFLNNLGPDVPLHFTAFHPEMLDV